MLSHGGLRTWLTVDTSAIKTNYQSFRRLLGGKSGLMAVVKSNAYGHSLIDFSRAVERFGVDWLGVDSIVEGLSLRKAGIRKPILVLGHTLPARFREAKKHRISLSISSFPNFRHAARLPGLQLHLKIDTGMHRQGFLPEEVPRAIRDLMKEKNITPEGVYTHFASAKGREINEQLAQFQKVIHLLRFSGFSPLRHAANTAGTIVAPHARLDFVRVGIGLYGLWPSYKLGDEFKESLKLEPVLSWKTVIGEIKKIPKGSCVGYDFTECVSKETLIAVCPVGYWHGYPRALSGKSQVIINGKRARVLGRVSMDMLVVDISNIPYAKPGQVVTLMGKDGKNEITADEFASWAGTINYEVITRLNPLMKRVYF